MKSRRSGALTGLIALGFVTFLGLTIWAWAGYVAHEGSLQQAGDAIAGIVLASITLALGFALLDRTSLSDEQEARRNEHQQPKQDPPEP